MLWDNQSVWWELLAKRKEGIKIAPTLFVNKIYHGFVTLINTNNSGSSNS